MFMGSAMGAAELEKIMGRSANGTRMIRGQEFFLNGTVFGYTPELAMSNAKAEVERRKTQHIRIVAVRRSSLNYAIYTHG